MQLGTLAMFSISGTLALCVFSDTRLYASVVPPEVVDFHAERAQIAAALSEPIAVCVVKQDTSNPVFHGCIDWHSAVHGMWALTSYTWATGDQRYKKLIENILQPHLLAEERKYLLSNPKFEMPYGRAWFLRLAIDHRRAFQTDLLIPFADDIAKSLMNRYRRTPPDPLSVAYQSATWALINLFDYGLARGNPEITDFVRERVRSYYLSYSSACPIQSAEIDEHEFMAVCTNWAWLVQMVMPHEEFQVWVSRFLPANLPLDPITSPMTNHEVGLNFSRAWGLWNLYWGTNDSRFLTSYLRHFKETYTRPALWKGDYRSVGHWVPQFGMLAVMVSYYDLL